MMAINNPHVLKVAKLPPGHSFCCYFVTVIGVKGNAFSTFPKYGRATRWHFVTAIGVKGNAFSTFPKYGRTTRW